MTEKNLLLPIRLSVVFLVALVFSSKMALAQTYPGSQAATATKNLCENASLSEAVSAANSELQSAKGLKLQQAITKAGAKVKAAQTELTAHIKACKASTAETRTLCENQAREGEAELTQANVHSSAAQGYAAAQNFPAMNREVALATDLTTTGNGKIADAMKCIEMITVVENTTTPKLLESLAKLGSGLLWLIQTAAALGFDLFGGDNNNPDLSTPEFETAGICSGVSAADTIACGGGTPDRQTASASVGSGGSFAGNTVAANTTAAEAAEREASSASSESPAGLASAGGSGGGGLGFGGGSTAGGGGAEEAGAAQASVTTAAGSGYFGGSGGGGGGGASGAKRSSFDRYGLRKRLAKAKTKAEKKKIIAAFKKENQVKGKGRGLASTGKDGKAGPFQDNFQVIRKAHKQNYRSLFHK